MKKTDIKKVKIGESVKLSKSAIRFHLEEAYEFNNIGGKGSERMPKEYAEGAFFSYMLLGRGYPYKAKIVDYLHNVGDGPGFRVEITFPCGQEFPSIFGYKHLIRKKK